MQRRRWCVAMRAPSATFLVPLGAAAGRSLPRNQPNYPIFLRRLPVCGAEGRLVPASRSRWTSRLPRIHPPRNREDSPSRSHSRGARASIRRDRGPFSCRRHEPFGRLPRRAIFTVAPDGRVRRGDRRRGPRRRRDRRHRRPVGIRPSLRLTDSWSSHRTNCRRGRRTCPVRSGRRRQNCRTPRCR